jgi:hypothetical protein
LANTDLGKKTCCPIVFPFAVKGRNVLLVTDNYAATLSTSITHASFLRRVATRVQTPRASALRVALHRIVSAHCWRVLCALDQAPSTCFLCTHCGNPRWIVLCPGRVSVFGWQGSLGSVHCDEDEQEVEHMPLFSFRAHQRWVSQVRLHMCVRLQRASTIGSLR